MRKVKPGDTEIPAADWNEVCDAVELLKKSRLSFLSELQKKKNQNSICVLINNTTDSVYNSYSAVAIGDYLGNAASFSDNTLSIFSVKTDAQSDAAFAITLEPIVPGGLGKAVVIGMCPAKVTISSDTHQYAVLDTSNIGKLISAESGVARILWKAGASGEQMAFIQLGGGGVTSKAEYNGYFKVVKASDTTVSIIDGADPVNANCGYYEHGIQRIAVVKPEAITVTATGFIYVTITYTTGYVFTFAFGTTLPASANGSIVRKIADVTFADGKITAITQAQQGILITPGVL